MRFFPMINNKFDWPIVIVSMTLLIAVVFAIQIVGVRNRIDTAVPGDKFEILDNPVSGILKSDNNFLNILMLRMKNPGIENNGVFNFELLDNQGNQVRQISFGGMNIGDPGDLRFQFEPIPDSAGKEYQILVTPDEAQPMVFIEVSKDEEISYTSYFRTVNKSLAAKSFANLLKGKISSNIGFFSFWILMLFGILVYDLRKKS